MQYLIVGLGNVGAEYALTRHNIGFMVLDQLAKQQTVTFQIGRLAHWATYHYRGQVLYMIQPTTYMNHSGKAVRYWLQQLKLPITQSLVVVDDLALPLGKLRIRTQGGAAGHNGLKSIETTLGTQAYPRLRVGIGHDFPRGRQADYVLSPFTTEEQGTLPMLINQACQIVHEFCMLGVARTMTKYNHANT